MNSLIALTRTLRLRALMASCVLVSMAGCQPDQATNEAKSTASGATSSEGSSAYLDETLAVVPRPLVNALDRQTAMSRKARVSNVAYDLSIDIAGSSEQFTGTGVVKFDLSNPDIDLTLDFAGGTVSRLSINGAEAAIDYNDVFLTLPAASLQWGENTVSIDFQHPYDGDGTGLHRFVDPADGRAYLYTYLWPYYANRLFPAFDQPNLKAEIALQVRAPADWIVVSTSAGTAQESGDGTNDWTFSKTARLPTYAFSLHAGPYSVWERDANGIPMRLMARQSLAEFVAVEEWFDVTRRGLEYFDAYFDIPYPYQKYDQLIVPDFNIGAMENIAAVTFSEKFVQRQPSSRSEREVRFGTILHEMAHMWFGDLVTHEWWNGLWLNESFATQMAAMATLATTEFTDTWHGFFTRSKQMAYAADSRITTHPIEVPVHSTADFFSVFDAITYQKGSSVLKQLAHFVGEENYRSGVSSYLKHFSYGNTELEDFIEFQATSSGLDLAGWTEEWLYTPGFNTLSVETTCNDSGVESLTVIQTAPEDYPFIRDHRLDVALYSLDEESNLAEVAVIPTRVSGPRTPVTLPHGLPCPTIVNPNHGDWAYARITLDEQSVGVLDQYLTAIPDPLARSIFLAALKDHAMAGKMPLADYLTDAMRLAETETNIRIQQQIADSIGATAELMQRLRPQTDEALAQLIPPLEDKLFQKAGMAESSDEKYIWFNAWLKLASTDRALEKIRALLDGSLTIAGLQVSSDIRWALLTALAQNGAVDIDALLAAQSAADLSDFGAKSVLTARAAVPDVSNKQGWLGELRNPESAHGLARQRAIMAGLFPAGQTSLQLEVLDEVLESLPLISATSDPYFIQAYGDALLQPMCTAQSTALFQSALQNQADQLESTGFRLLQAAEQADRECLALRAVQ